MATDSSILVWSILWKEEGAWQATVHWVTESKTQLKRLSTQAHYPRTIISTIHPQNLFQLAKLKLSTH